MAGRLSDTVVHSILDHWFRGTAPTVPGTYYVGLSVTTPTNAGTNITEPSGNAYARVAVTNNTTNWPVAATRSKKNAVAITFPEATGPWGEVTHYVIYKHATSTSASDFIGWGNLDTAQTVSTGGVVQFPVNALTIDAPGA